MKKSRILFYFFLSFLPFSAVFAQNPYYEKYPFLDAKYNLIQYKNAESFKPFFEKWKGGDRIVIAHFGDSHVQPDYYTAVLRQKLQDLKGNGGRGMIFPYSLAKTYSQYDFTSSFSGTWKTANSIHLPPRLAVGVSGFVAQTTDSEASVRIRFKKSLDLSPKKIKIFYGGDADAYSLTVRSGSQSQTLKIADSKQANLPFLTFEFPNLTDTLDLFVQKNTNPESRFELHGILLENLNKGLIYHNLGVGGANYLALPFQKLFADHFPHLNADLVVCDWGTNDIIYTNKIAPDLEKIIVQTIEKIRQVAPKVPILLTSAQDMNYGKRNISAAKKFAELVKKIAYEKNCLFYDWYGVAGGAYSMQKWHKNNLAQGDNVHLTIKGYPLKGELLAEALLSSLERYEKNNKDSVWLEQTSTPLALETKTIENPDPDPVSLPNPARKTYHTVKKGDTLSGIAIKYQTTVAVLRQKNKIKGDLIRAGQKLIVK